MGYYDEIEEIFIDSVDYYPEAHLYSKYANIVLNGANLEKGAFTTEIDIATSLNLAIDFFLLINPKYAYYFLNLLGDTEKMVRFKPGEISGSMCKEDGTVDIMYENSIEDVYTIVHEITHKFSNPMGGRSELRHIMGEVPTITMELLLTDYLIEKGMNQNDIYYRMAKRISAVKECSEHILFEQRLLKTIKNGEKLDKNVLKEYMRKADFKYYLDEIAIFHCLQYDYVGRYTLGLLIGLDIYNDIIRNGDTTKLDLLIDRLNYSDYTLREDYKTLNDNGILVCGFEQKKDFLRMQMEYLDYIKRLKSFKKQDKIGKLNN